MQRKTRFAGVIGELNGECCEAVTIATFEKSNLSHLGKRHTGPFCAGLVNAIDPASWRKGEILPALRERRAG
jgi:hypothetical protein